MLDRANVPSFKATNEEVSNDDPELGYGLNVPMIY